MHSENIADVGSAIAWSRQSSIVVSVGPQLEPFQNEILHMFCGNSTNCVDAFKDLDTELLELKELNHVGLYSANTRFSGNRHSVGGYATVLFIGFADELLAKGRPPDDNAVHVICPKLQALHDVILGHSGNLMAVMQDVRRHAEAEASNTRLQAPLFQTVTKVPNVCLE